MSTKVSESSLCSVVSSARKLLSGGIDLDAMLSFPGILGGGGLFLSVLEESYKARVIDRFVL